MTQLNRQTYQIDRPTRRCAFTDQPLQPGESYMATLIEPPLEPVAESPDQSPVENRDSSDGHPVARSGPTGSTDGLALKRLDVSMQAWQEGSRPEHLFSYWKTTVPQPSEKKKPFVDDQVMINLLRRLAETDQPQRIAFRFVLTLLLMRKKLLRYDHSENRSGQSPQTEEWWKLTLKPGPWSDGQPLQLEVLNPKLDEHQIKQASEQLSEILDTEL